MNKSVAALVPAVALVMLASCGTNTRLDDHSYRGLGQSKPKPVRKFTAANMPEELPTQESAVTPAPGSNASTASHVVRYGPPSVIDKIARTARIHCQPQPYEMSAGDNDFWGAAGDAVRLCQYRFPDHCGGHQFTLLSHGKKTALIYQPPDQNHYIIDTLEGTPGSRPGLWDQDDHVGSQVSNTAYYLQGDYNQSPHQATATAPVHLGWLIKASQQDKAAYGALYHQAVRAITACF